MPRFKNVSPLGWDLEVWDGARRVDVAFGEEVEVSDEAAANPTYTDAGVFEPVDASAKRAVKAARTAQEEAEKEAVPEPPEVVPVEPATEAEKAPAKKGDKE